MASVAAPSKITLPMQPAKAWQSMRNQHLAMQPLRAGQPSQAGQFMQPMEARQLVQPASALSSPRMPEQQGRRDMLAAFAFAFAAASAQAAVAEQATIEDKPVSAANARAKFAPDAPNTDPELPAAGDYTRYDKIVKKEGLAVKEAKTEAGTPLVAAPAWAAPAAALVAILTAGVPALLSPGEKAFDAQLQNEKGQRKFLEKQRQTLKAKKPRYNTASSRKKTASSRNKAGANKQEAKKGWFR